MFHCSGHRFSMFWAWLAQPPLHPGSCQMFPVNSFSVKFSQNQFLLLANKNPEWYTFKTAWYILVIVDKSNKNIWGTLDNVNTNKMYTWKRNVNEILLGGEAIYKTVCTVWFHFSKKKNTYMYMSDLTRRRCTQMLIEWSSREECVCDTYLILLVSPYLL